MGSSLEVVPATEAHARALAPRMRPRDVEEVRDAGALAPLDALLLSLGRSTYARALLLDGLVVAIWGVAPFGQIAGGIWLLGSPELDRHPKLFLSIGRGEVARMSDMYLVLTNYVSAANTASIRWLKRLGFTVAKPRPWGYARRPFCHFFMLRRSHVR